MLYLVLLTVRRTLQQLLVVIQYYNTTSQGVLYHLQTFHLALCYNSTRSRATDLLFVFCCVFSGVRILPWGVDYKIQPSTITQKSLMRHGKLSATDLLSRQINHQYNIYLLSTFVHVQAILQIIKDMAKRIRRHQPSRPKLEKAINDILDKVGTYRNLNLIEIVVWSVQACHFSLI